MTPRKLFVSLSLILCVSLLSPGSSAASLCGFEDVAIFALDSAQIGSSVKVNSGDVVVNEAAGSMSLGNKANVAEDVFADSLTVGNNVSIGGTAFCNSGYGPCTGFTPPVFDQLPPFQLAAPGLDNVAVGSGQTVVLTPERGYADITGGVESTVIFEPGTYNVRSISLDRKGDLLFRGPTEIRVATSVVLGIESDVKADAGYGVGASEIVFYVGNSANLGSKSTVTANFYVKNGTLQLPGNVIATGAFLGKSVVVGSKAQINLESAFFDQAPTADPQSLDVVSDDPVTIELTGSDPEGDDLTFSIEIFPAQGLLGPITPIQDDGQCSETVQACNATTPCPGTETCVLPPISRATVDYDPTGCTTDPEGEVTCPADAFTFGVTDSCGALATAVVEINPDDPSGPPPGLNEIVADDIEVDVVIDSSRSILLSAGAPESVASLTFAVETVPVTGTLEDEFGNPITVLNIPYDLLDPIVVYNAPASPGVASFTFSARDSTTGSPPCLSPSCDTGTVNIDIDEAPPLAQDLSIGTALNQPVQFTLQGNSGGTGTGGAGPQSQQSVSGPGYTYFYEAVPIGSGAGNGSTSGAYQRTNRPQRGAGSAGPPQQAVPSGSIALAFDAGWSATETVPPAFFWTGTVPVFACDVGEDDCQGVFTFTGAGCLSVTDDFLKGDQFRIYDNGVVIGTTPAVTVDGGAPEVGPDAAYLDPTYSSGSFDITGTGTHAIAIELIGSSFGSGRGYIRVDSGSCEPNLEVTSFSAPDSAFLDEPIGDQILTTVTNTGFAALPAGAPGFIGYYISSDAVITTADRLLQGGRETLSAQAPSGLAVGESVQIDLADSANIGSQFPDENPLTGSVFIGVLVDEFDDVAETDETDNTASQAIEVSVDSTPAMTFRIETLPPPAAGTLTDLGGALITQFQTFSVAPTLVFTPTLAFTGSTSFTYSVTEAAVSGIATVGILVSDLLDTCTPVGRDPGCAPGGGGGSAPESQQGQEALEREVAAGPSKGLTVVIRGSGSVATSPVMLSGDRVLRGLVCHGGACNKLLPEGAEISLYARPEGDDSEFVRWEGACWGSDPITTAWLTEHTQCTAVFGEKARE